MDVNVKSVRDGVRDATSRTKTVKFVDQPIGNIKKNFANHITITGDDPVSMKVAELGEINLHLPDSTPSLAIENLRVAVFKLTSGRVICSATWSTQSKGNYCSPTAGYPTELLIDFGITGFPLGKVNFGAWFVDCRQSRDFRVFGVSIPSDYFRDSVEATVPQITVRSAAC